MTLRVLGLDPGINGSCCIIERDSNDIFGSARSERLVDLIDLPTYGIKAGRRINGAALMKWITTHHPDTAFVEMVNAMPVIGNRSTGQRQGMAATSAFNFGRTTGACEAIVQCSGVPMTLVMPAIWKKTYGLKGGEGAKERARQYAIQRCPWAAHLMMRMKDSDRAEALLIALYGMTVLISKAVGGVDGSKARAQGAHI